MALNDGMMTLLRTARPPEFEEDPTRLAVCPAISGLPAEALGLLVESAQLHNQALELCAEIDRIEQEIDEKIATYAAELRATVADRLLDLNDRAVVLRTQGNELDRTAFDLHFKRQRQQQTRPRHRQRGPSEEVTR